MAIIIKSNDSSWLDVSNVWYNDMGPDFVCTDLKDCLQSIKDAATLLSETEGLTSFTVSETAEDVENLIADLRRFIYFSNAIHYEISEFVDNPFSVDMGAVAENLIDMNPSDYKYEKSHFLFFKNYMSLTDLVSSTIDDDELKKSFNNLAEKLNTDEVPFELRLSIDEAEFWKDQFEMAEKIDAATDAYFTPELRAAWPTMTEEERKKCAEEFKNILGEIYGGGENMVPNPVAFDEDGYGASYSDNHIAISPYFVAAPVGMYSLDKMIDTMTHEMRHRYQRNNQTNTDLSEKVRQEWSHPTVDSGKDYMGYYKSPREEDAKAFAALSQDDD